VVILTTLAGTIRVVPVTWMRALARMMAAQWMQMPLRSIGRRHQAHCFLGVAFMA
jgi:hypothetical protein